MVSPSIGRTQQFFIIPEIAIFTGNQIQRNQCRAYRSHEKQQRCLAHLIRKAIALAEGVTDDAAQFGAWLLKELRGRKRSLPLLIE